ncbi:hypothetical protein C6558_13305 [Ensifer sp. NM-2]|nr:hypothetical protein C6558_13305 [Ensifer sp. NM-2]
MRVIAISEEQGTNNSLDPISGHDQQHRGEPVPFTGQRRSARRLSLKELQQSTELAREVYGGRKLDLSIALG